MIKGSGLAFNGASFGSIGTYTYTLAQANASVSSSDACASTIVDLKNAAAANGTLSYSFDVVILTPTVASKSNGTLLYEVTNAGSSLAFAALNDGTPDDLYSQTVPSVPAAASGVVAGQGAGNAFLLSRGTTIVWSGWQGDRPQTLGSSASVTPGTSWFAPGMTLPVAVNVASNRALITGAVQDEFIADDSNVTVFGTFHQMASGTLANATLSLRKTPDATPVQIDSRYWTYTSGSGTAEAGNNTAAGFGYVTISRSALVASGLYATAMDTSLGTASDKGAIYRFSYTAVNPRPTGLGFLAVRDLVTFLRDAAQDSAGNANPLAGRISRTIATGVGTSGRFLRDFLWQGFNTNAKKAQVFDGMLPVSAGAGRTYSNYRWGKPGLTSAQQEAHDTPGDQFPFSYATFSDTVSGKSDGLMKKCAELSHCPKVFQLDSPVQFTQSRASLNITDGVSKDITLPSNVRLFYAPGSASVPQSLAANALAQPDYSVDRTVASGAASATPQTLNASSALLRALYGNLEGWIKGSATPLASNYPKLADLTLAVPTSSPASISAPDLYVLGLDFNGAYNPLSLNDESVLPSLASTKKYAIHLPVSDTQGNDRAGVKLPDSAVPLATYRGYSLRRAGFMEGRLNGQSTSQLALALNRNQRRSGDSRSTIADLYVSKAAYASAVNSAADSLVASGLLLSDDAAMYKNRAVMQSLQPYFSTLP